MIFLNLCCVPQKRTTSSLATKSIFFFGSHPIRFEGSSSAAATKKRKSVETVICSDEDFIISEHEPIKFIYPKYETQINLVSFCFWVDWAGRGGHRQSERTHPATSTPWLVQLRGGSASCTLLTTSIVDEHSIYTATAVAPP